MIPFQGLLVQMLGVRLVGDLQLSTPSGIVSAREWPCPMSKATVLPGAVHIQRMINTGKLRPGHLGAVWYNSEGPL